MTPIEILNQLEPNFAGFIEKPIVFQDQVVGWDCYAQKKDGTIIAGGTARDAKLAKQIAFAETVERGYIKKLHEGLQGADPFRMQQYPSSNGFAVGLRRNAAVERSVFEAVERWIWNLWIDGATTLQSFIPETPSGFRASFEARFDSIQYCRAQIQFNSQTHKSLVGHLVFCVAQKNGGHFWGSKVSSDLSGSVEHSLMEAARNLQTFTHLKKLPLSPLPRLDRVILAYGDGQALPTQLYASDHASFAMSDKNLLFLHDEEIFQGLFLCRSLCRGFVESPKDASINMKFW